MVSVSASVAVGRGFVPRSCHTKDHHKNGTNCLLAWHAVEIGLSLTSYTESLVPLQLKTSRLLLQCIGKVFIPNFAYWALWATLDVLYRSDTELSTLARERRNLTSVRVGVRAASHYTILSLRDLRWPPTTLSPTEHRVVWDPLRFCRLRFLQSVGIAGRRNILSMFQKYLRHRGKLWDFMQSWEISRVVWDGSSQGSRCQSFATITCDDPSWHIASNLIRRTTEIV